MSAVPFNLDFPYAFGVPDLSAELKTQPEDFYVEERLGFELSGAGEHVYLLVEKRDCNTQVLAGLLAEAAGVNRQDVSYSGLKDRQAVTRQWFSLYMPKAPSPQWLFDEKIKILKEIRHIKKLRTGEHEGNFFRIVLRNAVGDRSEWERRLQLIQAQGVPNYFGEQRFGHQGSNLVNMDAFLRKAKGKQRQFQDRMRVSAMRSWLFNQVLGQRVKSKTWNQTIEGECSNQASGPLWGRGRLGSKDELLVLEQTLLEPYANWCQFLEHCGLQQDRRLLILNAQEFKYQWTENDLQLEFFLSSGSFATVLLRELCLLKQNVERT